VVYLTTVGILSYQRIFKSTAGLEARREQERLKENWLSQPISEETLFKGLHLIDDPLFVLSEISGKVS
jgi:hypothetical protein